MTALKRNPSNPNFLHPHKFQLNFARVPNVQYLHKGIGTRSFTKTLTIADTIEVKGAEFKDGILRIGLENIIPEHKKPRKIAIGENLKEFKPQLLQEKSAA